MANVRKTIVVDDIALFSTEPIDGVWGFCSMKVSCNKWRTFCQVILHTPRNGEALHQGPVSI